ncbi:hypothetical protein AX774_g2045 [Zancudomyces culisetae]|uniref:Uncharacterized protein n=1 Tax=Zancudomyces culisetae TaxID=1213189 RepID=A0A1R1PTY6_ZANCU|nr:hypothetical protein AX774_g2045 [Zancudomyces culisetae]|eukprot:OMH84430.1 hypothetical protein AX774_g2045 [Zancudomyces culisetae]
MLKNISLLASFTLLGAECLTIDNTNKSHNDLSENRDFSPKSLKNTWQDEKRNSIEPVSVDTSILNSGKVDISHNGNYAKSEGAMIIYTNDKIFEPTYDEAMRKSAVSDRINCESSKLNNNKHLSKIYCLDDTTEPTNNIPLNYLYQRLCNRATEQDNTQLKQMYCDVQKQNNYGPLSGAKLDGLIEEYLKLVEYTEDPADMAANKPVRDALNSITSAENSDSKNQHSEKISDAVEQQQKSENDQQEKYNNILVEALSAAEEKNPLEQLGSLGTQDTDSELSPNSLTHGNDQVAKIVMIKCALALRSQNKDAKSKFCNSANIASAKAMNLNRILSALCGRAKNFLDYYRLSIYCNEIIQVSDTTPDIVILQAISDENDRVNRRRVAFKDYGTWFDKKARYLNPYLRLCLEASYVHDIGRMQRYCRGIVPRPKKNMHVVHIFRVLCGFGLKSSSNYAISQYCKPLEKVKVEPPPLVKIYGELCKQAKRENNSKATATYCREIVGQPFRIIPRRELEAILCREAFMLGAQSFTTHFCSVADRDMLDSSDKKMVDTYETKCKDAKKSKNASGIEKYCKPDNVNVGSITIPQIKDVYRVHCSLARMSGDSADIRKYCLLGKGVDYTKLDLIITDVYKRLCQHATRKAHNKKAQYCRDLTRKTELPISKDEVIRALCVEAKLRNDRKKMRLYCPIFNSADSQNVYTKMCFEAMLSGDNKNKMLYCHTSSNPKPPLESVERFMCSLAKASKSQADIDNYCPKFTNNSSKLLDIKKIYRQLCAEAKKSRNKAEIEFFCASLENTEIKVPPLKYFYKIQCQNSKLCFDVKGVSLYCVDKNSVNQNDVYFRRCRAAKISGNKVDIKRYCTGLAAGKPSTSQINRILCSIARSRNNVKNIIKYCKNVVTVIVVDKVYSNLCLKAKREKNRRDIKKYCKEPSDIGPNHPPLCEITKMLCIEARIAKDYPKIKKYCRDYKPSEKFYYDTLCRKAKIERNPYNINRYCPRPPNPPLPSYDTNKILCHLGKLQKDKVKIAMFCRPDKNEGLGCSIKKIYKYLCKYAQITKNPSTIKLYCRDISHKDDKLPSIDEIYKILCVIAAIKNDVAAKRKYCRPFIPPTHINKYKQLCEKAKKEKNKADIEKYCPSDISKYPPCSDTNRVLCALAIKGKRYVLAKKYCRDVVDKKHSCKKIKEIFKNLCKKAKEDNDEAAIKYYCGNIDIGDKLPPPDIINNILCEEARLKNDKCRIEKYCDK